MPELRFDDRVAVVTGGGRGLGRAYALLLASRGAKVVINDPGANVPGTDFDPSRAASVLQEIEAAGGEAVVCTESVATPQGGRAIVETAMDRYGRLDILIHSAGIVRRKTLEEMTQDDFDAVLDVHLRGAFHVASPAYRLMRRAGYGRVVLTSSCFGVYGDHSVANYAAAKAGLIGLSHSIALEGAERGVKSNIILPGAVSRMAEGIDTSHFPPTMVPEVVAPTVAWLAHDSCPLTGEMLVSMAGRVARAFVAESTGVWRAAWTIEQIAEQMGAITRSAAPVVFPVFPTGGQDHINYCFEMARKGDQTIK